MFGVSVMLESERSRLSANYGAEEEDYKRGPQSALTGHLQPS